MKDFILQHNCWYTNLPIKRTPRPLTLTEKYSPAKYPEYDNYNAIEVGRVADIPVDYKGVMGVPITFIDYLDPERFEVLGKTDGHTYKMGPTKKYINGKRHGAKTDKGGFNSNAHLMGEPSGVYYTADNVDYPLKRVFSRLLIRYVN